MKGPGLGVRRALASGLAPKSVDTRHLVGKAVTTQKLAEDAVTGAKVTDGSLGLQELATPPLATTAVRRSVLYFQPAGDFVRATKNVQCEPGETVVSGGFEVISGDTVGDDIVLAVTASRPVAGTGTAIPTPAAPATGWLVRAVGRGINEKIVEVYVVCGS